MRKLILASQSPRRKQLLQALGLSFSVYPSKLDEKLDPSLTPRRQVEVLSQQKAHAVSKQFKNAVIIAADTMVAFRGEAIGKPKNEKDAREQLEKLSGTTHAIVTGLTILDTKTKKTVTKSLETKIRFRNITDQEIRDYIKKTNPYDKAGGYAVHELGAVFVVETKGDFLSAVGLPVFLLASELKPFGIDILKQ